MAKTVECVELFKTDVRRATFSASWPHTEENISPRLLAENGFFFIGSESGDAVQCFACGKILSNWEPDDDVTAEHQRRNECLYLMYLKEGGDPQNLSLRAGLEILRCIYERKIMYLESFGIDTNELVRAFGKSRRK